MVRHRILTISVRYLYVVFLVGTGAMTLVGWIQGVDFTEGTSMKNTAFMRAIMDSQYIVPMMGIFKIIAGALLAWPKTAALGAVVVFPYAVNILLYVMFIAHDEYLMLGIFDFTVSIYLLYAYGRFYRPLWGKY